jgi:hypothetical protein
MIVDAGLNHIADQMSAKIQAVMSHMAIGTGTAAAVSGDTTLGTEVYRKALTSKTRTGNKVSYVASFGANEGSGNITELGLLNAPSNGDMLSRIVFSAKNKGVNDTLEFTVEHTYQRAV